MNNVLHTGITVSDLERSISFYRDVLGLSLVFGPTEYFEGEELSQGVGVPGAVLRQAMFKAGNGCLELFQYKNPSSLLQVPAPPNTVGAMHVAFRVDDAAKIMENLKKKNVPFHSKLNYIAEGDLKGWHWVYFKDPDGIVLELVQIAE